MTTSSTQGSEVADLGGRPFRMRFGGPVTHGVVDIAGASVDEFAAAVGRAWSIAAAEGRPVQVDLIPSEPTAGDPLLLQFLVGTSGRGSLLWHEDGRSVAAVETALEPLAADVAMARPAEVALLDPATTRVRESTALDAVARFVAEGTRTADLEWVEIPGE